MFNKIFNVELNRKTTYAISVIIITIALIALFPDISVAEEGKEAASIGDVVAAFKNKFNDNDNNSIMTYLFARAKVLFYYLALIQLSWSLMQLAMDGRLEMQGVVLAATRQLLVIGIMYWLLTNAQERFSEIINGFISAGKQVADISAEASEVSAVLGLGFDVVGELFKSIENVPSGLFGVDKVPIYFVGGICAIIILISFAFASLTFIIAQCKLYMSAMIATFFMGFGANDYTRSIAITAFKGVLCSAIEVFVMFVLFGIASEIFPTLLKDVSLEGQISDFYPILWQIIVATFVFCGGLKTLPHFASGILAGSPMGGGSAMGSGGVLAGAVAGGVATGLRTAIGGGLAGAGALAAAKAAGTTSKSALFGKAMLGAARGGFAAKQRGVLGSITTELARDDIQRKLGIESKNNNGQQQNSASAPSQNSNNVSP